MGCSVQLSRGGASHGYLCGVRQAESTAARSSRGERRILGHERLLNLDEVEGDHALLLKALTIVLCASGRMPPPRRSGSRRFHVSSRLRLVVRRAQETLRQARASDADAHHPLTCDFTERFEADLVKIAAGDVPKTPQGLLAEEDHAANHIV